jgi:hypothetical protein
MMTNNHIQSTYDSDGQQLQQYQQMNNNLSPQTIEHKKRPQYMVFEIHRKSTLLFCLVINIVYWCLADLILSELLS